MALKAAIVQVAAANGTPNYTQDFTDSNAGFSSDVKAAIFISGSATTNHSDTADARIAIGLACVAGTGEWTYNTLTQNGATPNEIAKLAVKSEAYGFYSSSGSFNGDADFNSFLSNGVRLTWTNQSSNELMNCILLGGDIEASVVNGLFPNVASPEVTTIAHGLSGAPEAIFVLSAMSAGDTGSNSLGKLGLGFWDGTNQTSLLVNMNSGTSQGSNTIVKTTAVGGFPTTTTPTYLLTITDVDATNVEVTTSVSTDDRVILLCLRGTTTPIVAKVGVLDTQTSTGNHAAITGMSVQPTVLFTIPTRTLVTETSYSDDSAGCFGLIAAVNNAGSGTQYGGVTSTMDDGSMPVDASHQSTNTQALRILNATGTVDIEATVNSWDSAGVTLNYSNAGASTFKIPYLAFGVDAALTKKLKLLAHGSAASTTGVSGVVFNVPAGAAITGTRIGEFSSASFEGTLESNKAVLKVPVADFGGTSLTTSDTPVALVRTSTKTTGIISCTVIEE